MSKSKKKHEDKIIEENKKCCSCGEECNCNDTEEKCSCEEENSNCKQECNCQPECDCHPCDENEDNDINKELLDAQNKINDLKNTILRNQAELQNYKRRKEEEISRMLKYSEEDIVKDFLPIIDNLERAIKMDDNDLSDEVSKFLEGFKIIYTNTINLLEKYEVKEIQAEGVEFDPTYHHAVLTEHDENKPEGVVLEVLQKGYMYKDRVIRPSMVKVNG